MMIDNYPTYTAHVKSGAVRPLGVSGKTTSPLFPGVPTISTAGVPGYDVTIWYAILGPAGMPADIVNRISNELRQIVGSPAIKQALEAIGSESMIQSPAEFAAFIRTENRKWADIVRKSGAKLD
jgi:tripartite-type tricarboxylate transporter receptor subunit TctC